MPRAHVILSTLLVAVASLAVCGPAKARLARLDPTFGSAGIVKTTFSNSASSVLVEQNGSILLLTQLSSPTRVALARYAPNGTLDHSFGSGGVATATVDGGFAPVAMTLAPGGKIIVVGDAFGTPCCLHTYVALARFEPSGKLDPSFGSGGIVEQTSPSIGYQGSAVIVQRDGKILVGGSNNGFMVARYEPDGRHLDPTFNGDGVAGVPGDVHGCGSSSQSGVQQLLIQGGSTIASGTCGGSTNPAYPKPFSGLLRYKLTTTTPGAAFDPTFGSAGAALAPFTPPNFASGIARLPDGNLLQAVQVGYSNEGATIGLAAFTPSGHPAFNFGTAGAVSFGLGTKGSAPVVGGVAVTRDRKILVAASDGGDDGAFALARRDASGSADDTFAPQGHLVLHLGSPGPGFMSFSGASGMAVGPDGRVVLAGSAHFAGKLVTVLLRFGVLPAISHAKVRRSALSYTDSEASVTTVKLVRLGRRRAVVTFTHRDRRGSNRIRLPRSLRSGRYLFELTPFSDGLTGRTVTLHAVL